MRRSAVRSMTEAAAIGLALAATLHLIAAWDHRTMGTAHVAAFIGAAVIQLAGVSAIIRPSHRWFHGALAAANGGVVAAWLLSRTAGLPGIAPAGEPVGVVDAVAAAGGLVGALGLARLAMGARAPRFDGRRLATVSITALAMIVLSTGMATALGPASHAGHRGHGLHARAHDTGAHADAHTTHHGGGALADAIAQQLGDTVHVHGLGGSDADAGPSGTRPASSRRIATGALPSAILATGDAVWVANRNDGSVTRIDPATLTTETFDVGGAPSALAHGFGSVWIADFARDVVVRLDPATGAHVGAPIAVEPGPTALALGRTGIWVAAIQEGTLQRIDGRTATASRPIAVGYGPVALAATNDSIWVLNALDRELVRIDQTTGRRVMRAAAPAGAADVTLAYDRLWVAGASAGTVVSYDPRTGARRGPSIQVDDVTDAGLGPTGLAGGGGKLWVANNHDKTVLAIDPSTRSVGTPRTFAGRLGTGPIAVRAAFGSGSLWVTDFDDGAVVRIEVDR